MSNSPFPWWRWPSTLWRDDTKHTFKWQHQISSAATKQRPLHRSSNSLLPCQITSCRCQLYTHCPASKLLGSFLPKTRNKCVTCRKLSGTVYNVPDPPPLLKSRMQQTQPFEVTELDYTGTLYVRNAGIETKVYICLLLAQQPGLFILKLSKTWLLKPSYSPFADLQVVNLFQGN